MNDKDWLDNLGKKIVEPMSALDDCAEMLIRGKGYTQVSYGADATGVKYVLTKGSIRVVLEAKEEQ